MPFGSSGSLEAWVVVVVQWGLGIIPLLEDGPPVGVVEGDVGVVGICSTKGARGRALVC